MTDTRIKGLHTKSALEEHLAELNDEGPTDDRLEASTDIDDFQAHRREVAWLRKEVVDLREQLGVICEREVYGKDLNDRPWLRIAATVGTTFILAKLVQKLRLGRLGAATVPFAVAHLDRRLR
jgi:hypothetical protein